MIVVGTDPNWQQDKLNRLMEALQLAKARREKRREDQETRAARQFQLIMSAAEKNPEALRTSTVRDFVTKNASLIPGLQEWYDLESATLSDPLRNPEQAYRKLMTGADAYSESVGRMNPALGGVAGAAVRGVQGSLARNPADAFDHSAKQLSPSERVLAQQHAAEVGVQIPMTDDRAAVNKKLSGPAYVLHNAHLFSEDEVKAARISLQLEHPDVNPQEKVSGALYVVQNPKLFNEDTIRAAEYQLNLAQPPWQAETPGDKLTGALAILNRPRDYSAEALAYARAIKNQASRSGDGTQGTRESGGSAAEKGRLTEGQASEDIDEYVQGFYEQFEGAGFRRISPNQRRKAAQMLRGGEDVDSYVLTSMFPDAQGFQRVIDFHMNRPEIRELMKARGEDPRARRKKIAEAAVREVLRLKRERKMPHQQARAAVMRDLLEGAL